jgi:exosortase
LVGVLSWLYADHARGLVAQWAGSPDAAYGAILAAVAVYLVWRDRSLIWSRAHVSTAASVLGLLLVAAGLLAYLAGFFSADLFTTRASFVIVAAGLVWALFGSASARVAATPLLFLLLAIPLPELVVGTLTSSLQTVAARIAETTLTAGGVPVYRDGNILELPATTLQVVEACSGLRSVVSLASVGLLLAWAADASWTRRALLVIVTVPIAVVVNGFRIAGTGAAAETWGPALTRDPWHTLAGWLTFIVSLTLLWLVRRWLLPEDVAAPSPQMQVAHP